MTPYMTLFEMIGILARRRYLAAEQNFSGLGLNHTEARLLSLLHEADGETTQEDLSRRVVIDRSNVGRALKRLEEQGYILRRKGEADKRSNLVRLTGEGHAMLGAISTIKDKIVQHLFQDLTEEEAGLIVDLLQKVVSEEDETIPSIPEHQT